MKQIKVSVLSWRNRDGSRGFALRWSTGGGGAKDGYQNIGKTSPNPTARQVRHWADMAAQRAREMQDHLNAVAGHDVKAVPIAQAAREFLAWAETSSAPPTVARKTTTLDKFVRWCAIGKTAANVCGVRIADMANFREWLALQLKPSSVNCHLHDLSAFWKWCIGEGYASANPAQAVNPAVEQPKTREIPLMGADAFWALVDSLPPEAAPKVGFIACTGMRISEADAVRWGDVGGDVIRVPLADSTTKRHARLIPIADALRPFLDSLRVSRRTEYVLDRRTHRVRQALQPHGLTPHDLRRWFRTALEGLREPGYVIDDIMGHCTGTVRPAYVPELQLEAAWPTIRNFSAWLTAGRTSLLPCTPA